MKMWSRQAATLLVVALAGCGAPRGFEPLDPSPPKASRGLWRYDASGYLRYDGHELGTLHVDEGGQTREFELEGDTQAAGDFETRVRVLEKDGLRVDVVAVTPLAEPSYFEAVTALIGSADAVLAAVPVRGDARLGAPPEDPRAARVARGLVEALDHHVAFVGQALHASDERWAHPRVDAELLERRRAAIPDDARVDDALQGLRELVADYGLEVVVHHLIMSRVHPGTRINFARRGPVGEEGFALEPPAAKKPAEDDVTNDFVWESRTLRDACLASLEPVLAQGGTRRVVVLAPGVTCRALAGALQAQGFTCTDERWLPAIKLAF